MSAKLFQKPGDSSSQDSISPDVAPRVAVHYGIPSTASTLTFDPVQHLLAVGTLDGRIKVIGGDNIEGLLMSPKPTPFKYLEFLQNQGLLVSVSNEDEIQVWDVESRCISSNLQWESNITAFCVICGTHYMYIGDEYGFLSVLKYDADDRKILQLPYHIPANLVSETADILLPSNQSIVGVLPQPLSSGNRVLIAYENGLIVLWDITEDRAVLVRGSKDLQLKSGIVVGSSNREGHEHFDNLSDHEEEDKEISSLCWVSTDGSVLAVGYVDGDILLWNLSVPDTSKDQKAHMPSNKVVKVQLSSENRRLPIIVLHWSPIKAKNGCVGQLFVYGGEEIGSEEVLTILELDWSSGITMLKCVHRVDLPLNGSFSDMIVMPSSNEMRDNETASLLVLTTPGQLHFYGNDCLSILKSEPEKRRSDLAIQYPATVPTVEPHMTVGKLYLTTVGSRTLLETISAAKLETQHTMSRGMNGWPLTGGIPGQFSLSEDTGIERLYIAGYQDGTVRVWDATFPVLSLLLVLEIEVKDNEIAGVNASVSALEFFSTSLSLAIGNDFGLVCLYKLDGSHEKSSLHLITEKQREVYSSPHRKKIQCTAIFSLLNSPVSCLQWADSGDKLAVGYESGQVAMLETSSLSILFLTDTALSSGCGIISLAVRTIPNIQNNSPNHSENEIPNGSMKEVVFVLSRDGHCILIESTTSKMICQPLYPKEASTAISLCILEENASVAEGSEEPFPVPSEDAKVPADGVEVTNNMQSAPLRPKSVDSLIVLCCENALYLYSSKSIIQGDSNFMTYLNLSKTCSWATIYQKDAKEYGLILVYQTGEIEIRSLPDFEVLGSTSLTSILRWNFKTNMEKLMSSLDKGQIALVNGCEFAIVSLLAFENDFRMPESLPCLYDKVLAAATDATSSFYEDRKQKQITVPGVIGGIMKGLKGIKKDTSNSEAREAVIAHLESIFSRFPFSDPLKDLGNYEDKFELNIDDIEIDELVSVSPSSRKTNNDTKEKEAEREKLFEGGSADTKPRLRTREEIIAKYRKTGDATSAASQSKDKLLERQEKLEKLSRRTEELQSGAESFASMANELAKNMERRKWWNI